MSTGRGDAAGTFDRTRGRASTAHTSFAAVVVPIRSFAGAKARLAGVLGDGERAALARDLADAVVRAASGLPTVVVSSDPEVERWAHAGSCAVLADPGSLDAAAAAGRRWARANGATRVVVAHADLPFVTSFDPVVTAEPGTVVVVPDHRDDGTPVLSLPARAPFSFAYGPGSFARHVEEAHRRGLHVEVRRDPSLRFDVDVPSDLERLRSRTR
jgi:2-phospho-L-lactate guanylyltransferase